MSPRRPLSIDQAAALLADAKMAYDAAVLRESNQVKIAATEPANGRVVKFGHRFSPTGKTYSYAAIRADHYRGDRRWFITGNDHFAHSGHEGIPSPATWVELVEFAIPGTIYVAKMISAWQPVSNLPAAQASYRVNPYAGYTYDDAPFDNES
jgi:hypothetical protein